MNLRSPMTLEDELWLGMEVGWAQKILCHSVTSCTRLNVLW